MNQEIEFDHENSNTSWWDAVCQDMKNARPAFEPRYKLEDEVQRSCGRWSIPDIQRGDGYQLG